MRLGAICAHQGRMADAEQAFKRAMQVSGRTYGEGDPASVTVYLKAAEFYQSVGKAADAEAAYRKALAVFDRPDLSRDYEQLSVIDSLADFYGSEALYVCRALAPPGSPSCFWTKETSARPSLRRERQPRS